jgi:thioredoxin-like negative regulator of GroEL
MQYEAAAALNPQIADVRLRLARVLVRRGCRNAAREELHEAIRLGDGATIREAEELLDVISAKPLRDDGVLWFASLLSDRPCWAN